jgi:hypothetical protein
MPKKRNKAEKQPFRVFHIYCEGEKTEPNYLRSYIAKRFPGYRLLVVIEPTKKNTPVQLVEEAIEKQKERQKEGATEDIFWVVYDRESEQKYTNDRHTKAREKAQAKNIQIALSNVCFEVWLLLHFQQTVPPYSNYDDLLKNSPLRQYCREHGLNDYDKGSKDIFKIVSAQIETARTRAKQLNAQTQNSADAAATQPHQWNPYTDMYKLLDTIDEFAGATSMPLS